MTAATSSTAIPTPAVLGRRLVPTPSRPTPARPPNPTPPRRFEVVPAPRPERFDEMCRITYWNHRCAHCPTWVPNHLRNCAQHTPTEEGSP